MTTLADLMAAGRLITAHRPWPRLAVDAETWAAAIDGLVEEHLRLLGLWAEPGVVHMALSGPGQREIVVVSLDCPHGRYPSVGAWHAPAIRLERATFDLFALRRSVHCNPSSFAASADSSANSRTACRQPTPYPSTRPSTCPST